MSSKSVNIVWLKRELRSQDHAPLLKAECAGIPYRIIYLFEPSRIDYPDTSPRHLQFVYHSIVALNKLLSEFNRRVEVFYGEAMEVFNYLNEDYNRLLQRLLQVWSTPLAAQPNDLFLLF